MAERARPEAEDDCFAARTLDGHRVRVPRYEWTANPPSLMPAGDVPNRTGGPNEPDDGANSHTAPPPAGAEKLPDDCGGPPASATSSRLAAQVGDHEKIGVVVAFVTVTVRLPSQGGKPEPIAVLEVQPPAMTAPSTQVANANTVFIRAPLVFPCSNVS